jgi:serine/threonine-protein kinase HipA
MSTCWICLDEKAGHGRYHPTCLEGLFGTPSCPEVELGTVSVAEAIATQGDRISISGVQEKLVMDLSDEGKKLVPAENGRYILKVPVPAYKHLPENEHLTMILAGMSGVAVPACGLVSLPAGPAAYIVKRFDRDDDGGKRRQEDFCSLLQRDPIKKYDSSAEECTGVVRQYSEHVPKDLGRLFLQFVVAFWLGDDDLHLKNLSLAQGSTNGYELSKAYDIVCTRLYPQLKKGLALPLDGRTLHHRRSNFVTFASRCDLDATAANEAIDHLLSGRTQVVATIARSLLPPGVRLTYRRELEKKTRALA